MKKAEQKLTLDGPTSYQIKVPGELDARKTPVGTA